MRDIYSEEVQRLLKDLEIVEYDIHNYSTRRHQHSNWSRWTPQSRSAGGIQAELRDLYEKKRLIVGKIEALARNKSNTKHESVTVTGAHSWRGCDSRIWELCLQIASRESRGRYSLIER